MSNNPQQVVTGKARLSYCHLFTPYVSPNSKTNEAKYSVTILIPKSDLATKQRMDAAIQAAIQAGVESRWNGIRPPQVPIPVYDGDGVRPSDGMPFGDECKGHWVLTASSKQAPQVVDANLNPIINQTEVYSGIYGRVSIRFFAYLNSGKRGIGCGLGNVQKLEDGEPLGGRTSAADDFGGGGGGQGYNPSAAPAYPQQQPSYQQPGYSQPYPPPAQPNYAQPYQQPGPGYGQPQQPAYSPQPAPQPQQPPQIDPITGKPISGGVMGIG